MRRGGERRRQAPVHALSINKAEPLEVGLGSSAVATVASDVSDGFEVKENGAVVCFSTNSGISATRLGEAWCSKRHVRPGIYARPGTILLESLRNFRQTHSELQSAPLRLVQRDSRRSRGSNP